MNIGLIGVGGIGAYHLAAIDACAASSGEPIQVIAVADPTVEKLAPQKAELDARGVRWHLDYREMLARETTLDAVVIATPIPFHFEMALACVQRGLWVHLEKPPVPLLAQWQELKTADTQSRISVGFQMVVAKTTQTLKRLITDGQLGQIQEIRAAGCWSRLDNYYTRASWAGRMMLGSLPVFDGPATNALAHIIHNLMYFAGEQPDEFGVPTEVEGELYRARRIESYDTACLRGKFASGLAFSVAVTHVTEAGMPFEIVVRGTRGSARLFNDGAVLESSVGVACDHVETTQELINVNYENFFAVAQNRRARFSTNLADTLGYVSATNAMLASSGGIHDIESRFIRPYTRDGQDGFDVADLAAAVRENLASGRLFSEQSCAWATAQPKKIALPMATDDFSFTPALWATTGA